MKLYFTTLILALVVFTTIKAKAQSVFNTNDSHVWYSYYNMQDPTNGPFNSVHYFTLPTNADTIINTISYKKMYYEVYSGAGQTYTKDTTRLAYCARYDSAQKTVYAVFKDSVNEQLFYKFNLHIGDTLRNLTRINNYNGIGFYTSTFIVKDTSTLIISTLCSKSVRYYLEDTVYNSNYNISWWDGAGSESMFKWEITPGLVSGVELRLACTTDSIRQCPTAFSCRNLVGLKSTNQFNTVKIIPNPANENILIETDETPLQMNLITPNGITLPVQFSVNKNNYTINSTTLPNGLYRLQILSNDSVYYKSIIINHY